MLGTNLVSVTCRKSQRGSLHFNAWTANPLYQNCDDVEERMTQHARQVTAMEELIKDELENT